MSNCDLRIDWATHEAAKYACENWHYSKKLPPSKSAKFAVWEQKQFIGAVVYGVGATQSIGAPYDLKQTQVCELVRVALRAHRFPVSQIIAVTLKQLKKAFPNIRLVVSYADPEQGHIGGIYKAGGWIYEGPNKGSSYSVLCPDGIERHARAAIHIYKSCSGFKRINKLQKHKYLMPLDSDMRKKILPLSRPYPKRAGSDTKDTPANLAGEGGSTPTPALHSKVA